LFQKIFIKRQIPQKMRDLLSERGGARTSKLNQWLKRLSAGENPVVRGGIQRKIRGKIMVTEYIGSIVSVLFAPEKGI
jgi:hypothetical protein